MSVDIPSITFNEDICVVSLKKIINTRFVIAFGFYFDLLLVPKVPFMVLF